MPKIIGIFTSQLGDMVKKNLPISLVFLMLFFAGRLCFAQELKSKRDLSIGYKINPLSLSIGTLSFSTELITSKRKSIQIGMQYFTGVVPFLLTYTSSNLASVSISRRNYFGQNIRNSGYYEPFVRHATLIDTDDYGMVQVATLGCVVGWQWIYKNNKSVDFFAGPYFSKPYVFGSNPQSIYELSDLISAKEENPYYGFWFRAGLTVGAFH